MPSLGAGAGAGAGRGSWEAGLGGQARYCYCWADGARSTWCWVLAATERCYRRHTGQRTGQHTLGMGCCPGRKVLVPAPLFACWRVLVLCAAALALAGLAGIMAAASAHQVCEASNMIARIDMVPFSSFPVLYYSCSASRIRPSVTAITNFLRSSSDEYCSSAALLPHLIVLPTHVYVRRAKELQEAAWSTSRSMDVCCDHLLQAAAWH